MDFAKHYTPADFERAIYEAWEREEKFLPRPSRTGKTFYLPIPPPNVTGNLHIGHSLFLTLQDIMVRYHRMKGDDTIYIPGTDHAGISTQNVVEKKLRAEGKSRTAMGREAFLAEVWRWKDEYAANINHQIRKMGTSCDWTRERFTFDADLNRNVEHVFVDLYKKGLIYRGEYMVNYSPKLESVVSDAEVTYKEEDGFLYHITYFVSGSDNELVIATTRPETLLADQALAVHPKDKRYKKLIGKSVILPIVNREIPIIGDDMVDMEFGTGVVKITPAHDPVDFEVARRHGLRTDYSVIDRSGTMNRESGPFAGMDTLAARDNIVELLRAKGNLLKVEPYTHKVGYCEVSGCRIETIVSTQWFARSDVMAKKVISGYKKKEFTIIPSKFNKIFEDWIYNLRDWCVSRQLWWGHQIPAYYDARTGELLDVTLDPESLYTKYGRENVIRDPDVLDTWFSSALWPFAVVDWHPDGNHGELYEHYYPAQMLETGHDILFFWVVRMLLMGYEYTGQTPFKTIYLHGLVLSEDGSKMSKSKGNVINPLTVIDTHGADALRLTLTLGNTPGNNMNFSMQTVENYTIFLNKLWNIARFVNANIGDITKSRETLHETIKARYSELLSHERWILSRLGNITERMICGMEACTFSESGSDLIAFIRNEFADLSIEQYKLTKGSSKLHREVLAFSFLTILALAHPYIPFVTERLYRLLTGERDWLIESAYPMMDLPREEEIEKQFQFLGECVTIIRQIRSGAGIKPWEMIDVRIGGTSNTWQILDENRSIVMGLCKIASLEYTKSKPEAPHIYGVQTNIDIYVLVGNIESQADEILRLRALITDKESYIRAIDTKLLDQKFLKNAPEHIVRSEQDKRYQAVEQTEKLREKVVALEEQMHRRG